MSWFRNLKLRSKFSIAFGLILIVVVGQLAVIFQALNEEDQAIARANRATALITSAWETRAIVRGWEDHYRGYLITGDPALRSDQDLDRSNWTDAISRFRAIAGADPEVAPTVEQIDAAFTTWVQDTVDPGNAYRGAANPPQPFDLAGIAAHAASLQKVAVQGSTFRGLFEQVVTKGTAELNESMAVAQAARSRVWRVVIGGTGLVFLFCVAAALYLTKSIVDPLEEMAVQAIRIGEGDLDPDLTKMDVDRRDELGEVAQSLLAMTTNLRGIVANVGDVTDHVGSGARALAEGADESAHLASEVAAAVNGITEGLALQAIATEEVSAAVTDIAARVRSARHAVSSVVEVSERGSELGRDGRQNVEEVIASMASISASMDRSAASVEELTRFSRDVVDIVGLIRSIADQTHLLALNATIEAARAGEAGRGFAVVADEVKALSDQATASTNDVARIVEQMADQVRDVHDAIGDGRQAVDGGGQAVAAAGESFRSIAGGVDDLEQRLSEVNDAVRAIDEAAQQITTRAHDLAEASNSNSAAVDRVAAASEQTAATAEEIGSTAQELAASGDQLRHAVAQFRMGSDGAGEPARAGAPLGEPARS